MRSQTNFSVASMGTARIAPATPHIQYQKIREMITRTGIEGDTPGEQNWRDAFAFRDMDGKVKAGGQNGMTSPAVVPSEEHECRAAGL